MNAHFKKTSAFLTLWFLVAFLFLQNAGAQRATFDYGESKPKTSNFTDFKITTWNVEWLGCLTNGPKDRELQINNVVSMIKTMNSDLVALQEVGTNNLFTTIDTLVQRLGSEWEGKMVPWSATICSQNQGIVYKKSKIKFIHASLVKNGGTSYDWSNGRVPALYEVNFVVDEHQIPISFINIHAKAYADEASYTRRKNASAGLKNLLDEYPNNTKNVVIIGDFNDYLENTICYTCGGISPYKNFIDDTDNYKGLSTGFYTVDNIIISNELFDNYLYNSAFREFPATQTIPNYYSTTSDHIPTSVSFRMTDGLHIVEFSETQGFHIYPNPTTGQLRIKGYELQISDIEIFDVFGRMLNAKYRMQNAKDEVVMDISHLPNGIYFLRVEGKTVKIVKN